MVVVFIISHNDYDTQDESLAHRHVWKVMLLRLTLEAINSPGLPFSSLSSPPQTNHLTFLLVYTDSLAKFYLKESLDHPPQYANRRCAGTYKAPTEFFTYFLYSPWKISRQACSSEFYNENFGECEGFGEEGVF